MDALIAEKKKIEEKIAHLMKIEELDLKISALQAEKNALISEAPELSSEALLEKKRAVKRGPKKISEMTPEERVKHEAACAARRAKKEAKAESVSSDSEKKRKSWTPWALENGFKTGDHFYVNYEGLTTTLSGLWEDDVYYLCSPLIAQPSKEVSPEKVASSGYGLPIKKDSPTFAAMLVKAAHGCTSVDDKGYGPRAQPNDVKIRVGDKMVGVYKITPPPIEVVVA